MSKEKMNMSLFWTSIGISLLAIVVSIVSFARNICTDYNFIVGVLSLLVTILIGYQIYKTIEFDNWKKGIEEKARDESIRITKESMEKYHCAVRSLFFSLLTETSSNSYSYELAVNNYFIAIDDALSAPDDLREEVLPIPLFYLKEILRVHSPSITINDKDKLRYFSILSRLPEEYGEDKDKLMRGIENCKRQTSI